MPYRICKSFEIESGHMLSKHPDKCQFPHGHTRKVEFVLEAETLDNNEMVCDFKVVRDLMAGFLDQYDHAMCMNTDDPQYGHFKAAYGERVIGFEKLDPTTELLAKAIYDFFKTRLSDYAARTDTRYPIRPSLRVIKVRLWETSSSWAEYAEENL
ncbi:MAG: 6-carboxytetrahydropterin synthase [Verrucomicrobiota bacterium]